MTETSSCYVTLATLPSGTVTLIYHIAEAADWEQAQRDGQYTMSTRGRTLAEEGFIHASTASQVALVANAFYRENRTCCCWSSIPNGSARSSATSRCPASRTPTPTSTAP